MLGYKGQYPFCVKLMRGVPADWRVSARERGELGGGVGSRVLLSDSDDVVEVVDLR